MIDPPKLAISLTGLSRSGGAPWVGQPKKTLEWTADAAHNSGIRRIVLDAMRPGFRPRELGTGARRDLAGVLRRRELEFAGVDLFLPSQDLLKPETLDRAFDAIVGAIGIAADLAGTATAGRVVSVTLPEGLSPDVVRSIEDDAARQGVRIADHAWPQVVRDSQDTLSFGLDPVLVIESGKSPAKVAARAGDRLGAARLGDRGESGRCVIGDSGGKLDLLAYGAAIATVGLETVAVDLRGLHDPGEAVERAAEAWKRVFTLPG